MLFRSCTLVTPMQSKHQALPGRRGRIYAPHEQMQRHRDRSERDESNLQAQQWWLDGTRHADPSVMLHPRALFTSTPSKGSHPATDPTSWQHSAFMGTHNFPYTLNTRLQTKPTQRRKTRAQHLRAGNQVCPAALCGLELALQLSDR